MQRQYAVFRQSQFHGFGECRQYVLCDVPRNEWNQAIGTLRACRAWVAELRQASRNPDRKFFIFPVLAECTFSEFDAVRYPVACFWEAFFTNSQEGVVIDGRMNCYEDFKE